MIELNHDSPGNAAPNGHWVAVGSFATEVPAPVLTNVRSYMVVSIDRRKTAALPRVATEMALHASIRFGGAAAPTAAAPQSAEAHIPRQAAPL